MGARLDLLVKHHLAWEGVGHVRTAARLLASLNWCEGQPLCGGNLGIPRSRMPQIRPHLMGAFVAFLKEHGVEARATHRPVRDLRATQREIDPAKVESLVRDDVEALVNKEPMLATEDGYILDGHHRWAALLVKSPDVEVPLLEIQAPVEQVLSLAWAFPATEYGDQAGAVGGVKVAAFDKRDLLDAARELTDILEEHESLMGEARVFGVRAAAVPRGLMPLKDAQRIVTEMAASLERIQKFQEGLFGVRGVPPEMGAEWDVLVKKAATAADKFQADLDKAREALERHEDLLVGANFQAMFQAVRLAVLDLDLADDVDLDFATDLNLTAEPAYATGTVRINRGATTLYQVVAGYRATDDLYWGNLHSEKRRKTFKHLATKTGHAHLPRFVRELVEQVKALDDADSTGVFRSRKKVELRVVDPTAVQEMLTPLIEAQITGRWGSPMRHFPWRDRVLVNDTGVAGSCSVSWEGWGWHEAMGLPTAKERVAIYDRKSGIVTAPFEVTLPNGQVWEVSGRVEKWEYTFLAKNARGYLTATPFTTIKELEERWPPEWQDNLRSVPIDTLRARAAVLRVEISGTSKTGIAKALQAVSPRPSALLLATGRVAFTLRRKSPSRTAVERVSEAWLRTAGGCGFTQYAAGSDAKRAFQKALAESRHERGHRSYSGTVSAKDSFVIRKHEPMTGAQANDFISKDMDRNDKWGPAFAVPISEEKVLGTDQVTVTVEARDEADAQRRGAMLIKATGRVPPRATIQVTVQPKDVRQTGGTARKKVFEVSGLRKQVIVGDIKGWVFYGMASC